MFALSKSKNHNKEKNMSIKSLFDTYKALVVFDTETTGLNYTNDQIIELAALRVELDPQGEPIITKQMDTFISLPQGEKLPQRIVQLTGITDVPMRLKPMDYLIRFRTPTEPLMMSWPSTRY